MALAWPWALLFLSFIPAVILMYMLKQKFQEKEISSVFLWDAVLKDIEVNTPWQKLKNNLLLILQIIIITLMVLAAANPFISLKDGKMQNVILVIDNSGSMNSVYGKHTRIEEAKEKAIEQVKGLSPNSRVTIISSSKFCNIEGNGITKGSAVEKIKNIKATECFGDINESISLVKSMGKQFGNYKAYFYTDNGVDLKGVNGQVVSMASNVENVSLDYIGHGVENNLFNVLVRVNNRGENKVTREVCLFSEKKLLAIENVELEPKENKTVYFKKIPLNTPYVYAEISEKDGLKEDNIIYHVLKQPKVNKALLVSKGNVFIEKALAGFSNLEVYKTEAKNNIDGKYDLYIFDGEVPENMPKQGDIICINPPKNSLFNVGQELKGGEVQIKSNGFTKYMENSKFVASKFRQIDSPYWAEEIFKIQDKGCGFVGELNGRKIVSIGFQFQNSDFPLTPEFPIFMNNLMEYFFGASHSYKSSYLCGEDININALPDTRKLYIESPDKKRESLDNKYPIKPFSKAFNSGIYKVVQKTDKKEQQNIIAVNFPVESESSIKTSVKSLSNAEKNISIKKYGMSIQNILIIIALIFLVFEWIYYVMQNKLLKQKI